MRLPLCLCVVLAASPPAFAQTAGGGVPAYEPPPAAAVQRDGEVMKREPRPDDAGKVAEASALVANFASAYQRNGSPRLALYWNRQLSEALNEWYSPARMVASESSSSTMSGEITLNQSGSSQSSMEIQRRVQDQRRVEAGESFEWEFQDGFLAPFLDAGAQIVDRTAMMRLTGADMEGTGERIVEMRALQGKADYLMEILVAANWRSTTGYELRARILEVKTARIVAYVNSKGLKSWKKPKEVLATNTGFVDPDDQAEDDESFGPAGEDKFRATGEGAGFVRRRKPPKLERIANDLALNTMSGLMKQWK